jgi:hypothetical protein
MSAGGMPDMSARPRLKLSGDPPRRVYRGLRRLNPLEQQVQAGVLDLLARMPNEVCWAFKQPAGSFVIVRRDPGSGLSVRQQLEAAAEGGYFKRSQIAYITAAPEGVLDIALQLTGIGTHCELEVKQPGAKPSEAQRQRIDLVRRNGGCADWTDDIDEVQALIGQWIMQQNPRRNT